MNVIISILGNIYFKGNPNFLRKYIRATRLSEPPTWKTLIESEFSTINLTAVVKLKSS